MEHGWYVIPVNEDEWEENEEENEDRIHFGIGIIVVAYILDIILTGKALKDDALMKTIGTNPLIQKIKDIPNKELKVTQSNKEEKKADENVVDKMKQLKQLLDDDLITKEEFDNKKKELMDTIK